MEHQLRVAGVDCDCKSHPDTPCPVCEWGADICKICGMAEGELLDFPQCPGSREAAMKVKDAAEEN